MILSPHPQYRGGDRDFLRSPRKNKELEQAWDSNVLDFATGVPVVVNLDSNFIIFVFFAVNSLIHQMRSIACSTVGK